MASFHGSSARSKSSQSSASSRSSRTPPSSAGRSSSSGSGAASKPKRPSDILNPKTVDPFSNNSRNQSAFAAVYSNGGVPCRLVHGSVKHKLAWNTPPEQVPFDPTLITLAEGLKETVHPHAFVARTGFKEILEVKNAGPQVLPILPKVTVAIRGALAHSDKTVFVAGLEALVQLSNVVGSELNPHLNKLLVPVSKHISDKKYRDAVVDSLHVIEQNGGRRFQALSKRVDEVTKRSTEKRVQQIQKTALQTVQDHFKTDEEKGILRKTEALGDNVSKDKPSKDGQSTSKQEIDPQGNTCTRDEKFTEVNNFMGVNEHLYKADCTKQYVKSGLEKQIDKAVGSGDIETAERLSDQLATRDFGVKVAEAFQAKEYLKRKKEEEESIKAKKKKKLAWGFEHKHRWETKSNM